MSFQVDQLSSSQKKINFVIPQEEVAKRVGDAFKNVIARLQLPGFRRGKVPRRIVEERFGKQIRQDVASDLIEYNFRQAAQDVEYLGQPQVTPDALDEGRDFTFSITVQVRPEIEVKDYKALVVDFPVAAISDEQVDASIQTRVRGQARLVDAEEGHVVEEGDLALCRISEKSDSTEADWKVVAPGTLINTKAEKYYPGVVPLILGAAKGDIREGAVEGKPTQVEVLGIRVSRVPDLSDEVATNAGFEGGIEGMRVAVRLELEGRANDAARNQARVSILQKITAANEAEVPQAMIENHFNLLIEEMKIQNTYRGRDPRSLRLTESQRAEMQNRARFAAHASIVLEAIARQEGIVITDADLDAKYQEIADIRGQRVEAIRGYFVKENAVGELRKRLSEERTLDWLLEQAELKTPEISAETAPTEPVSAETASAEASETGSEG
jgi:trigger factor